MNAMQFGDLIHKVLERFGKESRGEGDRKVIEALILSHLETESRERFGQDPSPAVRVQLEAARVRLISFARVQAEEYAKGWRILESEYKIGADHPQVLSLAGLKLTAKIDRIEENGDLIRIIDYKSQGSLTKPEKKHLGSPAAAFFKEAEVTVTEKPKAWTDLQLPLYRRIAETLYPGRPVETAYLVLAADPEQSGVKALELDADQMESAMKCAEAVASRMVDDVFWPPRTLPSNWEDKFESLFLNGKPEHCIDEETVRYLKGKKEAVS
jgi:ATP-dependent exoDNAse (exonuclease V) beta subunit